MNCVRRSAFCGPAARHQSPGRSAGDALRNLQLVHRGLRHRRPEGRQGAAAGTEHLTMKCAKCGADNREGAKFCNECAASIEAPCPKCGTKNKPGAKFCDECGTSLSLSAVASPKGPNDRSVRITERASAENVEGERKTVTMLFADIKGSMELI